MYSTRRSACVRATSEVPIGADCTRAADCVRISPDRPLNFEFAGAKKLK